MTPTESENLKRVGRAAFNAGWAAAMLTLADSCAAGGQTRQAEMLRRMANNPPNVEVGEGKTPPENEIVMMQSFPRRDRQ